MEFISEAKRLHALGFHVHWLFPKAKNPINDNWSKIECNISNVIKCYKKNYNLGTRLGTAIKSGNNTFYLSVIDVDIKSTDPKHFDQVEKFLQDTFKDALNFAPVTLSGRGNGSKHIWCLSKEKLSSKRLYASNDKIEVYMPTAKPSDQQIKILGIDKIKKGIRLRPAFEIDFMCDGKQVVLPPSIHPDTNKAYTWENPIEEIFQLPVIDFRKHLGQFKSDTNSTTSKKEYTFVEVDEASLIAKLPKNISQGIIDGDDVDDRSSFLFSASMSMIRAGFNDSEIISTLTDQSYFLGQAAFEHAKTKDRNRAALWVDKYCLTKAHTEIENSLGFSEEIEENKILSSDESKEQLDGLITEVPTDWRKNLDKTENLKIKPTLKNCILILQNDVGENLFQFNEFKYSETIGCKNPFGLRKNNIITDRDVVEIKHWLAKKWKIEPHKSVISEAIVCISQANAFHPVKNYLENLVWDGEPRIDNWLIDFLNADVTPKTIKYIQAISRKFLIAAVTRVYEPGCKFDYMLIFEGAQGIGKSTVGSILASPDWFLDELPANLTDKDAAQNLQGHWIVEFGELKNLRKNEVDTVKAYVSRSTDKFRPPYGVRLIESPRQCVFYGTTNNSTYLNDKTGGRRFWPVKLSGNIDLKAFKEIRDQLWAEAYFKYQVLDEKLYLDDNHVNEIAEEVRQEKISIDKSDMIEELLTNFAIEVKKERLKYEDDEILAKNIKRSFQINELFTGFGIKLYERDFAPPLQGFKFDNSGHILDTVNSLNKLGFRKFRSMGKKKWCLR